MPLNSQGVRIPSGYLDTCNDDYPGGGTSPGIAPAQKGAKVTLLPNATINVSLAENRLEGTFQYVQTLSTDTTTTPQLGQLAFWADKAEAIVSTAVATYGVENLAGVFLGQYPAPGKWGFIKTLEGGGRTLVDFTGSTPAAGELALAQTGSNFATRVAAGTDIKGYTFGVVATAKGGTGSYGANHVIVNLRYGTS